MHSGRGNPPPPCLHNKILSHDAGHKIPATFCSDYSCAAITQKDYFAKNNLGKGSANLTVSAKHDYERKKALPRRRWRFRPLSWSKDAWCTNKDWKTGTLNVLLEWNAKRLTPRGEPLKQWTSAKCHLSMAHFYGRSKIRRSVTAPLWAATDWTAPSMTTARWSRLGSRLYEGKYPPGDTGWRNFRHSSASSKPRKGDIRSK